jgi:amino acid transporter
VSISAAIANLGSTIGFVEQHNVWFAVGAVVIITLLNLRGVKESGNMFAIPTYIFIASIFIMIGVAIFKSVTGQPMLAESANWEVAHEGTLTGLALIFLLARAFSSGTTALTGIEAVANGVPAFKEPKSKNAATTLALLGLLSMLMFSGITWLAMKTGVQVTQIDSELIGLPEGETQKTVIIQVAAAVFDNAGWAVLFISLATALILALAANTAFNGFPVLGSILARDGYLPRQLHTRGDRLAFSNGIFVLAGSAALLIIAFQADVTRLIQLYIIGVFIAFTLSQFSMVRHWGKVLKSEADNRERQRCKRSRVVNAIGFIMTGTVLVIVVITKFTNGAWIVIVALPIIFYLMLRINRHYDKVRRELATLETDHVMLPSRVHALVLVSKIDKPTLRAIAYARASRPTVIEAVTANVNDADTERLQQDWVRRDIPVTLRILDSPYREITSPIIDYVKEIRTESPNDLIAVFVPQYVVGHWWEQVLHNQSALRLKSRLLFSNSVMVISVPWQLESSEHSLENDF